MFFKFFGFKSCLKQSCIFHSQILLKGTAQSCFQCYFFLLFLQYAVQHYRCRQMTGVTVYLLATCTLARSVTGCLLAIFTAVTSVTVEAKSHPLVPRQKYLPHFEAFCLLICNLWHHFAVTIGWQHFYNSFVKNN